MTSPSPIVDDAVFHPLGHAPSSNALAAFSPSARTAFEEYLHANRHRFRLNFERYRLIKTYLRDPSLEAPRGDAKVCNIGI